MCSSCEGKLSGGGHGNLIAPPGVFSEPRNNACVWFVTCKHTEGRRCVRREPRPRSSRHLSCRERWHQMHPQKATVEATRCVFFCGLAQLLCAEWDVCMSPKWRMIEWSGCNLLIMVYILRPRFWLHSICMDWEVITVCVCVCVCECVRVCVCVCIGEREKEPKIYSCHDFKCRLLMLFIFMSSPILKCDCFTRSSYRFI